MKPVKYIIIQIVKLRKIILSKKGKTFSFLFLKNKQTINNFAKY